MIKRICICFLFVIMFCCSGYKTIDKYVIRAEKNAALHNSLGLNYIKDRAYYAAIQEFKIAISLSPSTQATAIYQNNLGETYMFIGYPDQARTCFEDSLKLYGLNFQYYINLAKCYMQLGIAQSKIKELSASNNIYDKILLGILKVETGQTRQGIIILDEFCTNEPDLIITSAVRQYLKDITGTLKQ